MQTLCKHAGVCVVINLTLAQYPSCMKHYDHYPLYMGLVSFVSDNVSVFQYWKPSIISKE